jgi:hypothetical protein
MESTTMFSTKILSTVAALALLVPIASYAQGERVGGRAAAGVAASGVRAGGGAPAMRMGGGAPAAQFGGGAPRAQFSGGVPRAQFSGGAPGRSVAADVSAGRPSGGAAWNGRSTAWNGDNGAWRGGERRRGDRWWPGAVAAGAVVGGAIAANDAYAYYGGPGYYDAPEYYDDQYADNDAVAVVPAPVGDDSVAYCAQRYRSYDPASGTYLGFDGLRHSCP